MGQPVVDSLQQRRAMAGDKAVQFRHILAGDFKSRDGPLKRNFGTQQVGLQNK
jgi:hypothetical protein